VEKRIHSKTFGRKRGWSEDVQEEAIGFLINTEHLGTFVCCTSICIKALPFVITDLIAALSTPEQGVRTLLYFRGKAYSSRRWRLIPGLVLQKEFNIIHRSDFQVGAPASMEITLNMTFSTDCTGLHLSEACSYMVGSSPGVCRIEIQTVPSGYTVVPREYFVK
jgi:hypothetical protein